MELTKDSIPYEVGVARYRELARGQIAGDSYGMLKLLVSTDDLKLLGVHIFGTNATEMVHIGQAVMGCGGTVDYLVDAVFNYPTFSEAYKVAALDVTNKMRALSQFRRYRASTRRVVGRRAVAGAAAPRRAPAAAAMCSSNGDEYDTFSAQPPPSQATDHPGDRRTADPGRAAGAVDQARRTAATGNPLSVIAVLA